MEYDKKSKYDSQKQRLSDRSNDESLLERKAKIGIRLTPRERCEIYIDFPKISYEKIAKRSVTPHFFGP